jgi:hypothetical protein
LRVRSFPPEFAVHTATPAVNARGIYSRDLTVSRQQIQVARNQFSPPSFASFGEACATADADGAWGPVSRPRLQINGCAFCVQFHILQGERLGMSADKLNLVVVWREAPLFSARERAALAWTESLTAAEETSRWD